MHSLANAKWTGGLKDGSGVVSTESGALKDVAYSFVTRFEGAEGSNPEELIAAAHAGCYSMALSAELGKAGMKPESVETSATVTLEMLDDGPKITKVHLVVKAHVPGAEQGAFDEVAQKAKSGCPISRLLNAEITLDAGLES